MSDIMIGLTYDAADAIYIALLKDSHRVFKANIKDYKKRDKAATMFDFEYWEWDETVRNLKAVERLLRYYMTEEQKEEFFAKKKKKKDKS